MLFSNLIAEDTNAFQQLNRGRLFLFLASLHRYRLVIEKKKLCRSWLRDTGIVVVILITRAPVAASIVILSIV